MKYEPLLVKWTPLICKTEISCQFKPQYTYRGLAKVRFLFLVILDPSVPK